MVICHNLLCTASSRKHLKSKTSKSSGTGVPVHLSTADSLIHQDTDRMPPTRSTVERLCSGRAHKDGFQEFPAPADNNIRVAPKYTMRMRQNDRLYEYYYHYYSMIIKESDILLGIASCVHLAMLFDLECRRRERSGSVSTSSFNPNHALRCIVLPDLIHALRAGRLDTKKCTTKTETILRWSLAMHLERDAQRLAAPIFNRMLKLYDTLVREDIRSWWADLPLGSWEKNQESLTEKESSHELTLSEWKFRHSKRP